MCVVCVWCESVCACMCTCTCTCVGVHVCLCELCRNSIHAVINSVPLMADFTTNTCISLQRVLRDLLLEKAPRLSAHLTACE